MRRSGAIAVGAGAGRAAPTQTLADEQARSAVISRPSERGRVMGVPNAAIREPGTLRRRAYSHSCSARTWTQPRLGRVHGPAVRRVLSTPLDIPSAAHSWHEPEKTLSRLRNDKIMKGSTSGELSGRLRDQPKDVLRRGWQATPARLRIRETERAASNGGQPRRSWLVSVAGHTSSCISSHWPPALCR